MKQAGLKDGHAGIVTLIQHVSLATNLNIHLHSIFLDAFTA
jgi:hypothetical protein